MKPLCKIGLGIGVKIKTFFVMFCSKINVYCFRKHQYYNIFHAVLTLWGCFSSVTNVFIFVKLFPQNKYLNSLSKNMFR